MGPQMYEIGNFADIFFLKELNILHYYWRNCWVASYVW